MRHTSLSTYIPHFKALLTLGLPIIVGQLGSIIQGLADTIMVGQYSTQSLAAAGFVNNLMNLILIFALGYSYALTPVVGPFHAKSQYDNAGQTLRSGLIVNGIMGLTLLLMMTILYFFLGSMG